MQIVMEISSPENSHALNDSIYSYRRNFFLTLHLAKGLDTVNTDIAVKVLIGSFWPEALAWLLYILPVKHANCNKDWYEIKRSAIHH